MAKNLVEKENPMTKMFLRERKRFSEGTGKRSSRRKYHFHIHSPRLERPPIIHLRPWTGEEEQEHEGEEEGNGPTAPAVCFVPTLNLQRAHSVVRFTSEGREEDILSNIFYDCV